MAGRLGPGGQMVNPWPSGPSADSAGALVAFGGLCTPAGSAMYGHSLAPAWAQPDDPLDELRLDRLVAPRCTEAFARLALTRRHLREAWRALATSPPDPGSIG